MRMFLFRYCEGRNPKAICESDSEIASLSLS